jgi:hypothetical protein
MTKQKKDVTSMDAQKSPSIDGAGERNATTLVSIPFSAIATKIKKEIKISDVLFRYLNVGQSHLKTSMRQFKIKCPFHEDRTPSLAIYPNTDTWKCYAGCGQGDQIQLLAKALNIRNGEAIKLLVTDFGLSHLLRQQSKKEINKIRRIDHYIAQLQPWCTAAYQVLIAIQKKINQIENGVIKTIKDLDLYGDIYHLKPHIEYLLDLFEHPNGLNDHIFIIIEARKVAAKWLY